MLVFDISIDVNIHALIHAHNIRFFLYKLEMVSKRTMFNLYLNFVYVSRCSSFLSEVNLKYLFFI